MAASAEHERRDKAICRHAVRYHIALPATVGELFFDGKQGGHILRKLADLGSLQAKQRALPKGLTYYLPSPQLCREHSVPKERGERGLRESALDFAIAVDWFCAMQEARRFRLETWEACELLGRSISTNVVHVLTEETDCAGPCLLRVYHATCGPSTAVKAIRQQVEKAAADSVLRTWSAARQYGYAVLCPTSDAVAATRRAFERSGLHETAEIIVGLGPVAASLHAAIRETQKK